MKMINNSKHLVLAAVAGICMTTFALGARADDTNAAVSTRTVHYADLNLNTKAGAKVLYERIRNAADQVCGNTDPHRLAESVAAQICVNQAVTSSVRAVSNSQLTNAYDEHFGATRTAISVAALR